VLRVTGTARVKDTNNDKRADQLTSGRWTGLVEYAGSEGFLDAFGNTFEASLMSR
jgi:hypothetical protein